MKSISSEASSSRATPAPVAEGFEKRSRRTFAEAASELGRSIVGGTLGGGRSARGGRSTPASSASASANRLRDVLDRDRAFVRATEAAEARAPEHVAVPLASQARSSSRVCGHCGSPEHPRDGRSHGDELARTVGKRASTGQALDRPPLVAGCSGEHGAEPRTQRARVPVRVPPPPPPRAAVAAFLFDDDDEEPSVHNEPTKVGRPPSLAEVGGGRSAALAAAAASAFGSSAKTERD